MLFQKENHQGRVNIKSYSPGEINISGKIYTSPILVSEQAIDTVPFTDFDGLNFENLDSLIAESIEVFLVGSGEKHKLLSSEIIGKVNQKGVAIEVMSTRNACHTFQVLMHENRVVSALLFP